MDWITVIMWFLIIGIGGISLSFVIMVPIRFFNMVKRSIIKNRRSRIINECFRYTRYNINSDEIYTILNELGIPVNRSTGYLDMSIEDNIKFYNYLYARFDPEYRDNVIDDILKID